MVKLFDRYVLKEILSPFLIGLLVYTFVLLMNQILWMTELFIEHDVSLSVVLVLFVYLIPSMLAFTLPMSVLLGILAGLSRMSSDVEITAFKTLGVSYGRLARPLLIFALCCWALTSYLTFYLAPQANHKWMQSLTQSVLSQVQFNINPREFNESLPNTMIYVQDISQDNEWKNIIVYVSEPRDEPQIVYAESGRINFYPQQKRAFLELFKGVEHTYPLAEPEKYRVIAFDRLEENVDVASFFPTLSAEKTVREKNIAELLTDLKVLEGEMKGLSGADLESVESWKRNRSIRLHRIEVHKKISIPFACFIFALLGLPLGASTRKGGRTSGFTISIGIIIVYYVLITAGEQLAKEGKLSAGLGMWGANILISLGAVFLFVKSVREDIAFSIWQRLFKRKEKSLAPRKKKHHPRLRRSRPSIRFPNILDRYIIKRFLIVFLFVFISLFSILVIIAFFERIDEIYEHNKTIGLFLSYIWYRIPEFVHFSLPVSTMASALLSLGLLVRSNEITAMKACGLSIYRIIVPVVFLAFLASVASFYIQENIYPYSNKKAEEAFNTIMDIPPRSYSYLDRRWVMGKDRNRIYHFRHFDPFTESFSDLSVFEFEEEPWSLKRRIFGEKGYIQENKIVIANGWLREFQGDQPPSFERIDSLELFGVEGRSYFVKEWKEADQLNFGELAGYIAEIEEKGFETVPYRVDLNFKLSYPLAGFIMALLGIPFAFSMGRRGTLVGMGLSLLIAAVYWGSIGVFKSLGNLTILSPFLAAWGPNLIFGLIGLYLLFTLRT